MDKSIKLIKKDGSSVVGKIKSLDEGYIEKIMNLQGDINKGLTYKEWYSSSTREEFLQELAKGKIVGCVLESDSLIAIGTYVEWGYEEHNYGYDLNINKEKLLKVGQIGATLVHKDYRGNGLQKIICKELEKIAKERKKEVIAVTVHPDNIYSLRTFEKLDYKIRLEKLKYGGLRRFVLSKKI